MRINNGILPYVGSPNYESELRRLLAAMSIRYEPYQVTQDYTFTDSDEIDSLQVDATAGNVTITLPLPSGVRRRRVIKIDSSSNTVTVTAGGTILIDLATTKVLSNQFDSVELEPTGSGWLTLNFALYLANGIVTNAKLANMADGTIKGNASGSSAAPSDLTALPASVPLIQSTISGTNGSSYGLFMPIVVCVKDVTVRLAGVNGDIATITLPPALTRFSNGISGTAVVGGIRVIAETAAGTLAAASFSARDAAGGAGAAITAGAAGPAAAGLAVGANSNGGNLVFTTSTIYIYQAGNSANAGTVSVYVSLYPAL